MTSQEFTYWLQGYAELGGDAPTKEQWNIIKEHLGLVFNKVTKTNELESPLNADDEIFTDPDHNQLTQPYDISDIMPATFPFGTQITC